MQKYHLISCTIQRGGFDSERSFEIALAGGEKLVGSAYVAHFYDQHKQPLDEETPSYDESLQGFVKCRIVRGEDQGVLVELPSADVIRVPDNELLEAE